MKRQLPALFAAVLASTLAFADAKEDAQKKVDEAFTKSCEMVKKQIAAKADVCADENTKMAALDCADKAARKAVDFLALNTACSKKQQEASKAKGEAVKAEAKAEKAKGSKCKVLDEAGATVAEHQSEGGSIKCQTEIREKVKTEKCEPGKKLTYKFVGESGGKEGKPTALNITCPKK